MIVPWILVGFMILGLFINSFWTLVAVILLLSWAIILSNMERNKHINDIPG